MFSTNLSVGVIMTLSFMTNCSASWILTFGARFLMRTRGVSLPEHCILMGFWRTVDQSVCRISKRHEVHSGTAILSLWIQITELRFPVQSSAPPGRLSTYTGRNCTCCTQGVNRYLFTSISLTWSAGGLFLFFRRLNEELPESIVVAFATPHVVFFLVQQPKHADALERATRYGGDGLVKSRYGPREPLKLA